MGLAAEPLCQLLEGTRTVRENEAGCPCLPETLLYASLGCCVLEDAVLKFPNQPLPGCRLRSFALQEERCLSLPLHMLLLRPGVQWMAEWGGGRAERAHCAAACGVS